jgi:LysR family glycine cleavage system transcriptional activator
MPARKRVSVPKKMRRLPPLNALKAFEAAARLSSFTKAAGELSVTHGAISRQVALLEGWLGVMLFQRTKSHLVLTDAGRKFYDEASAALDRIALAVIDLARDADPVQLTISAPPTFTLRWLIPRMATFQRKHLDINVRLTTSLSQIDFSKNEYNVAVRGATQPLEGVTRRHFLAQSILPICHPDLLEKQPLAAPADLAHHTQISYATESYGWQDWFSAVNAPDVKPAATLNFEQMYFALQAALEGLGVALLPYFLVIDDIAAGRLCAPLGTLGVRTRHYSVYLDAAAPPTPAHTAFCDWLESEGKATMALCEQLMAQGPRHASPGNKKDGQ